MIIFMENIANILPTILFHTFTEKKLKRKNSIRKVLLTYVELNPKNKQTTATTTKKTYCQGSRE